MNHRSIRTATMLVATVALALTVTACTPQQQNGPAAGGGELALSDVKVALIPGGAHPYFQPWKTGGEDAATEFGIGQVTFNETAEWDQTKQNAAVDALAAQGYNAFGLFGVSATDIDATFETLKRDGYAAVALGACPVGDTMNADFCLSTDTATAAYTAAKAAIDAMGGTGNLVHLTGNAVDTNTQRRIAGVQKAVDETDGAVTLLTTVTDVDKDLQTAQKAVNDLLATQGSDIQGMISTAGNPGVAVAQGVSDSGLPIVTIATDDDPIVIKAVREGRIAGTVVQNPYGQGYLGTWALAKLASGECTVTEKFEMDSGSFLVTAQNVDTYTDEQLARTKELLQSLQNDKFTCN